MRSFFVYYESIKRELKIRPIYECRCDERLKTKVEEFTLLTYTGFLGGLEHLKVETRFQGSTYLSPEAQMRLGFLSWYKETVIILCFPEG
jgi:hypothetical protein